MLDRETKTTSKKDLSPPNNNEKEVYRINKPKIPHKTASEPFLGTSQIEDISNDSEQKILNLLNSKDGSVDLNGESHSESAAEAIVKHALNDLKMYNKAINLKKILEGINGNLKEDVKKLFRIKIEKLKKSGEIDESDRGIVSKKSIEQANQSETNTELINEPDDEYTRTFPDDTLEFRNSLRENQQTKEFDDSTRLTPIPERKINIKSINEMLELSADFLKKDKEDISVGEKRLEQRVSEAIPVPEGADRSAHWTSELNKMGDHIERHSNSSFVEKLGLFWKNYPLSGVNFFSTIKTIVSKFYEFITQKAQLRRNNNVFALRKGCLVKIGKYITE